MITAQKAKNFFDKAIYFIGAPLLLIESAEEILNYSDMKVVQFQFISCLLIFIFYLSCFTVLFIYYRKKEATIKKNYAFLGIFITAIILIAYSIRYNQTYGPNINIYLMDISDQPLKGVKYNILNEYDKSLSSGLNRTTDGGIAVISTDSGINRRSKLIVEYKGELKVIDFKDFIKMEDTNNVTQFEVRLR